MKKDKMKKDKMKKDKMKRLSFSYPNTLKKELEKEAGKDLRSLPSLIKMILDKQVNTKEK